MNYAVLIVPDFALHALLQERSLAPRPRRGPGGGRGAQGPGDARPRPRRAASRPGLAATLAMSRCPGIALKPRDPGAEVEAHRLLVAAAFTLAPARRVDRRRVLYRRPARARTGRAPRRSCGCGPPSWPQAGLPLRIGAGATPLLASYAARCAGPVLIVDDPEGFLRPLPLAFAEPTPEQEVILRGWGIGTLGALTALPKAEVGRRMGAEGALLWERAAGQSDARAAPCRAREELRGRVGL